MANLLQDIASYFVDNDVAMGYGEDIFCDYLPEEPDNIIYLTEYKGSPDTPFDRDLHHRSVQIVTRNVDADTGKELAMRLHKTLTSPGEDFERIQFTPDRWGLVYIRQTPFRIGTDENDRALYCFNIGVTTSINYKEETLWQLE